MVGPPACRDPRLGEWVEAYAAGTLDRAERAEFERHLRACPACQADVAAYEQVVGVLPAALAAASPETRLPPGLRAHVLQAVEDQQRGGPAPFVAPPPALIPGAAHSTSPRMQPGVPSAARSSPLSLWERVRVRVQPAKTTGDTPTAPAMWWRGAGWRAAALAAAAVITLAAGWSIQRGVALAREQAQLRAEYAALVSQQATVLDVVDARNTIKRNLAPPSPPANAAAAPYGKLYTRPDVADVVAMAGRLPEAPAGQAYHLWVTENGRTRLAGTLAVNQGFGLLVYDAGHPGPTYEAAWMTVQPPGTATPAGPTVLQWQGP